jgi:hypothetical protein
MRKLPVVAGDEVRVHPAVIAWHEVSARRVERVVAVKKKRRGAVFALEGVAPGGTRVFAKRCDRTKGVVERVVYQEVLPRLPAPSPACHGVVERDDSIWLFLEDAGGRPYDPDQPGHREAAARWLAELHTAVGRADVTAVLPERGPAHYRAHLVSILDKLPRYRDRGPEVLDKIGSIAATLESGWGAIESTCASAPEALVHGDCLSKNVHVRDGRVAAFDWGGAGWGCAGTDLGQLALPHRGPPDDEPDLAAYLDVARRRWPRLDVDTVRRLAMLGQLFWALKVIDRGMEEFEQTWREPEHILADFRIYGCVLARST